MRKQGETEGGTKRAQEKNMRGVKYMYRRKLDDQLQQNQFADQTNNLGEEGSSAWY